MYDMYHWDQAAGGGSRTPDGQYPERGPGTSVRDGAARPASQARAVQAVQVALDRRDNGGDPVTSPDQ